MPDAQPKDNRQLLRGTEGKNDEKPRFQITVRNAIVDALGANGLVVAKGESPHIYLGATAAFGWSSRLDQDPESRNIDNLAILNTWIDNYTWNPFISQGENSDAAANQLLAQFIQFHEFKELRFRKTT